MKRFFSSDYHFFHKNIIKYCTRPFDSVEQMNKVIIKNHNERVKKEDTVYFLGDFGFYASRQRAFRGEGEPYRLQEILVQLNGDFIMLKGNHDKSSNRLNIKTTEIILHIGTIDVQLIHNPKYAKIDYPLILCGHKHEKWKTKELHYYGKKSLIINVGVDVWDFKPVEWREIQALYDKWKAGRDIGFLNIRSKSE